MKVSYETKVDKVTRQWIRNASDREAVKNGCRFDWERGAYTVWWIERYCRLYEGADGEPLILHGCHKCDYGLPVPDEWDDDCIEICRERAELHAKCVAAGHRIDWQYDCLMRIFGWVRWSEHHQQEIRRFRKAKIYIPKKNKKSPTEAACALYLTCGDGEPGQHVYLAAKDGEQVRDNMSKHILNMLDQSEELKAECNVNLTKLEITHLPSKSTCRPLSSSNKRTQKSKEGLNGSVCIDETHVVDREFINRIDRAGISRIEPLHMEFSTAGDDPDSYGKEEFDLCLRIIAGESIVEDTFAAVYAAPQDLSDAALDKDPLKYGMEVNPAMGHTVNPEEYLSDYNSAKEAPYKLALFKMYRLNIWQNSASPWLNMTHWDKGQRNVTYEDFEGRECWAALDLSTVSDFSALALCFPDDEEDVFSFLWWFWLPEETASENQHKVDFQKWVKDPRSRLMLTEGACIHFGAIRSKVRELSEKYDIREIAFDDWNAEQTTQEITEGVTDHKGHRVEMATGIPRVEFGQGIGDMNEPTKRFEAAVIKGQVRHNGDPLARWMARNTTVKVDINNNYKPIKSRDLSKKIDGTVAAIMARARAVIGHDSSGYYDREDAEVEYV